MAADQAVADLDELLGSLLERIRDTYDTDPLWLVAGEYAITPVRHVAYPNRILREAGLLTVREEDDGEHLDFKASAAFAMVDHQFSHLFVKEGDGEIVRRVADLFSNQRGIDEVLVGDQLAKYDLDHPRSGEVVLVSKPDSWQAYYWWLDDARAPGFSRTVDIHRKPGYDPVELHFDPTTKSIPLDATLIKGSTERQYAIITRRRSFFLPNPVCFLIIQGCAIRTCSEWSHENLASSQSSRHTPP